MVSWTGTLAPSAVSMRGFGSITPARTVMDLINTATVNLRTVWLFPQDPSRNHRAYRLTVAKLEAPIIPFMPLLIKGQSRSCDNIMLTCTSKLFYCWISPSTSLTSETIHLPFFSHLSYLVFLPDMTFTHEGNKTCVDNLVNFEKMVRLWRSNSWFKSLFSPTAYCSVIKKHPKIILEYKCI